MAGRTGTVGRLAQIWVYPVKSMRGQSVDAAVIDTDGVAGDRAWSVRGTAQTLSARGTLGLAEVSARVGADGVLGLDIPGQAPALAGAAADAALSLHLGCPVRLVRAEDGTFADVAAVHLVSTAAVAAAAASGQTCTPGGTHDPRANLIIDLDGPADDPDTGEGEEQGPERGWVGRELTIGSAVLRVTRTPKHCLGVYAEVLQPGPAAPGDAVRLR